MIETILLALAKILGVLLLFLLLILLTFGAISHCDARNRKRRDKKARPKKPTSNKIQPVGRLPPPPPSSPDT